MSRRLRLAFSLLSVGKYLWASALVLPLLAVPRLQSQEQPIADQGAVQSVTVNDYFAEIGRRAPGFGGIYVDEQKDTIYVYMVNGRPDSAAVVDRALTDVLGPDRPPQHRLQLLPGKYTFLQLKEWSERASPRVLAIPGTVETGIDHWTNGLEIGVENPSITPQVEAVLDELGVPREAVNIEEMPANSLELPSDPVEPVAEETQDISNDDVSNDAMCDPNNPCTLRSKIRPLVGGIQIQFERTVMKVTHKPYCTLSFVATTYPEKPGQIGIVTNSHCTVQQGGTSKQTIFSQPSIDKAANQVAQELMNGAKFTDRKGDPCYVTATKGEVYPKDCKPVPPPLAMCPKGKTAKGNFCRRSDSSFSLVTVKGDNIIAQGYIARPTRLSPSPCVPEGYEWDGVVEKPNPCLIDWNGAPAKNPPDYFRIVGEVVVPISGRSVYKVGRTTGRTQGLITNPCSDVREVFLEDTPDAQPLTQLCQIISGDATKELLGYMSFHGDSGSPVFMITDSPLPNDVRIVGIHFDGSCKRPKSGHILCPKTLVAKFSPIGEFYSVGGGVQNIPFELGPLKKCAVVFGMPPC